MMQEAAMHASSAEQEILLLTILTSRRTGETGHVRVIEYVCILLCNLIVDIYYKYYMYIFFCSFCL